MIQDPLIRILLAPISLLYGVVVSLRDFFYRKRLLMSFKFDVPVISVGNLSVGGSGKTPHIEYLIRLLRPYLNVATLSRGYGRKTTGYQVIQQNSTAEQSGDEPLMFKLKYPDVFVTVNEQRALGIPQIMKDRPDVQAILLDDAFQHRSVEPGLNILLTEYNHPFTRDYLLPSGRLREWPGAYHRADIVIVTKCPEDLSEQEKNKMYMEINPYPHQQLYFSSYKYYSPYYIFNPRYRIELKPEMSVLAVSAIANSEYMQDYLESKVDIVRVKSYTDHHQFDELDVEDILKVFEAMPGQQKLIVTTEKDAVRLAKHRQFLLEKQVPIMALPLEVYFHFDGKENFDAKVKRFLLDFKV